MKKISLIAVAMSILASSPESLGSEGWLLVSSNGRYSLVYASGDSFLPVAALGNIAIFDDAGTKIGLVTRDNATRSGKLLVVDKKARKVLSEVAVYPYPANQLLGPTEDLLLLDRHAYYVSVRYDYATKNIEPNVFGGHFDLNRVFTETGTVESFPLPRELTNPRLTGIDGKLVVYSGLGGPSWTFDEVSKNVQPIAGQVRPKIEAKVRREMQLGTKEGLPHGAFPGTVVDLPDETRVFVDTTGTVQRSQKDGKTAPVWNLTSQLPSVVPALTRIIEVH